MNRPPVAGPSLLYVSEEEVLACGRGYNVGTDVAVFVSRYVGVGGGIRFNEGRVLLRNTDIEVGRFTIAAGVRFRF